MKRLFVTTAVIEIGAGLALLSCPSETVVLLLGVPLESAVAVALGRVTGVALCALAVANWLAHYDEQSRAARGLVSAMLLYNVGAAGILATASIGQQSVGIAQCPAVVLHAAMSVWCLTSLLGKPMQAAK